MLLLQNMLQRRLVRNEASRVGFAFDGHKGEWVKSMQMEVRCRLGGGEWASRTVPDLPERNTAEERGGRGGARGKEERGGKAGSTGEWRRRKKKNQRSSVSGTEAVSERRARTRSMALFSARRRSFTLRKLWTWARAGKACTEEDREIQSGADRGGMRGGGTCAERKESYWKRRQAHTYTQHTGENNSRTCIRKKKKEWRKKTQQHANTFSFFFKSQYSLTVSSLNGVERRWSVVQYAAFQRQGH